MSYGNEKMKKIIIWVGIIASLILGINTFQREPVKIYNAILSKSFLLKSIPIIDIRTEKEWKETGIVYGSKLITFYNEDNTFDEELFLAKIQEVVSKEDTFAILCRSGNRSNRIAKFLNSKGFTHVINLAGGIKMIKNNEVELVHK